MALITVNCRPPPTKISPPIFWVANCPSLGFTAQQQSFIRPRPGRYVSYWGDAIKKHFWLIFTFDKMSIRISPVRLHQLRHTPILNLYNFATHTWQLYFLATTTKINLSAPFLSPIPNTLICGCLSTIFSFDEKRGACDAMKL